MGIKIEIDGANASVIYQQIKDLLPAAAALSDFTLQELVAIVEKRAVQEGVDLNIAMPGDRLSPAEQRRADAIAKLRGELEESIAKETETEAVAETAEPAEPPKAKGKKDTKSKAANANGRAESAEDRKNRLIVKLGELFNEKSGVNKANVRNLLVEYGDGAKTFTAIAAERFPAIEEAMEKMSWAKG